ncbi:MAG: hypothetical protein HYT70_02720 [Candidatus Aenigmarchaeota archaeon]|nr:hypothetical protein [Candidatus Aenigmarchaeota archaeon]
MGILGIVGNIIVFPFRLIFGRRKEKEEQLPQETLPAQAMQPKAIDTSMENLKAKIDMMMAQVESIKLEYQALDQRIQNMERMLREIYMIAKS